MILRNASLSLAAILFVGCATSDQDAELPPPKKNTPDASNADVATDSTAGDAAEDSANPGEDTGPADTGADVAKCTPLSSENKPCGKCGTSTRTCSSAGTWNEWSMCTGEKTVTTCIVGDVRANECGKCGTQKDVCDPVTCEWVTGACLGEGVCAKGEVEVTSASCPVVGEIRERTCTDSCTWSAYGDCTLPKGWIAMTAPTTAVLDGRYWHTGVWTGTEMIVWGGRGAGSSSTYVRSNGAAYNLLNDTWRAIAPVGAAMSSPTRWQHTAVWTGSKMIVWGGLYYYSESSSYARNDGAAYDPTGDSWSSISTSPLSVRWGHGAVWSTTTNEMIVWGGGVSTASGQQYADGATYDPLTNTWEALPPAPIAPRWKHSMIWTGSEVVIWGGYGTASGTVGYLRDGARFDPKTKIWTKFPEPPASLDGRYDHVSVFSGKELLVWGGYGTSVASSYGRSDGARYLPGGSWTSFSTPLDDVFAAGTSAKRYAVQAWFGGGKLWLWSGALGNSSSALAQSGGAWYDPATDKWGTMDLTGAPTTNRARASVVWTGKEAILWGGSNYSSGSTYYNDGVVYRP